MRRKNREVNIVSDCAKSIVRFRITVFGGLEGVPTGSALGNEIKAYHDAMESLQSGGLESGDPGNVLRDSENAVHQNASAIDDAMNL